MIKESNNPVTMKVFTEAMHNIDQKLAGHDENFVSIDERFKQVDERFDQVDERFDQVDERFDQVDENIHGIRVLYQILDERVCRIEEKMVTKDDHMNLMTLVDELMTEVRASRDERILFSRQLLRMDDRLVNHERRICVLEVK